MNTLHNKPPLPPLPQRKKSVLDVGVSIYESCFKPVPVGTANLLKYLRTNNGSYEVNEIRKIESKEERDKLKIKLPGITPSGIFKERNNQGLVKHSGFICVDIDQKDNTHIGNYSQLKKQLSNLKEVAYCGLSVSGRGYMVLIRLAYPGLHEEQALQLEKDFQSLGIIIDSSCKDIPRFRFLSWDPDAYFNHDAKKYEGLHKEAEQKKKSHKPNLQTSGINDEKPIWDIFNEQTDIVHLLEDYGWEKLKSQTKPGNTRVKRPGKRGQFKSGEVINGKILYVFSPSTVFEPNTAHNAFSVYAHYEHGGDYSKAAKQLYKEFNLINA